MHVSSQSLLFHKEYFVNLIIQLCISYLMWNRGVRMVPEGMAAVLRAPNQLCYFVCFFALFVTYFLHNVAATVSYYRK
jgi:hypothetical protein